jgi:type III pantothenate kinase
MLLAIDVGNTHSVFGLWDGTKWLGVFRRSTDPRETEDELAVWLKGLFELRALPLEIEGMVCASVVPQVEAATALLGDKWFGVPCKFLRDGASVNLEVVYDPPTAVGADRIANALGALQLVAPPLIIVDFGTATTFDTVDSKGRYVGGAILPGVAVASEALATHTAKLPQITLEAPPQAVGKNTVESLQSGIMLGYGGAIDALAKRIKKEVGEGATVIATGGLAESFVGLCEQIDRYEPNLTLNGLVAAFPQLP